MTTSPLPDLDFQVLDKQLDYVKTRVFLGSSAAYLATIMTGLEFGWKKELPTAATNGKWLGFNPHYFHFLKQRGRESVYVHELWHVGKLHPLRRGNRDPLIWNYACDTDLDNGMSKDGYEMEGLFPPELGFPATAKTFVNPKYDGWAVEDIYDDMVKNAVKIPAWYAATRADLEPQEPSKAEQQQMVGLVMMAVQTAKKSGNPGAIPGDLEQILDKFLNPKLPWGQLLYRFMNQLGGGKENSWRRPNRRYTQIYMPSRVKANDGLAHLAWFLDVSGSVSAKDLTRFSSEFKHVKDTFQPQKMTMIQFDTKIQKVIEYGPDDDFDRVEIKGRGGTSLTCVRDWIIKNKPTAAMVFSDMLVTPMEPLPPETMIPMIWIGVNARANTTVPHGQLIHISED